MDTSYLAWIPIACSLISVVAAAVAVLYVRRGSDADLKGDVNDLARLVERLAKDNRRDKMQRVRRGERVGSEAPEIEVPPGAENIPMAGVEPAIDAKTELRRRVLAARGIGR